jgi:hypothetical protein
MVRLHLKPFVLLSFLIFGEILNVKRLQCEMQDKDQKSAIGDIDSEKEGEV